MAFPSLPEVIVVGPRPVTLLQAAKRQLLHRGSKRFFTSIAEQDVVRFPTRFGDWRCTRFGLNLAVAFVSLLVISKFC